jgi:hypothetical protein
MRERGGRKKELTFHLRLQGRHDVPEIDEVERLENVRGGDGLVLFRDGDVVCAARRESVGRAGREKFLK